ncbi:MAG: regulatory iron-sulfur-containing complex subunit RicT [Bacteroidia bacterium]
MACGSGSCGTGGGCSGGCSSGACNKLNTFDWLAEMDLPPHVKPFDIVEVRFKGTRKEFYKNANNIEFYINEYVVVESESGYDIGKVSLKGELVKLQMKKYNRSEDQGDFKKIIRKANEADIAKLKENQELEVPTMYKARSIAMELGLSMKLSDVEYQGDRRKAIFYYTAEERVDFRELIKRLADSFKVRIEMRQIGYRQEAGRLGGIGSCGRELCCSTWLTDFKMVHTNSARYQNLSLNQLKLSGQCGKLKCCLNFELDSYLEALKEFPENSNLVLEFADEKSYKVVKTDILKRLMWFAPRTEMGGEWISLPVNKVNEYAELNKNGVRPELVLHKPVSNKPEKIELDFQNDMGRDSLTRLDDRNPRKGGNKNRPKQNPNQNKQGNNRPPQGAPNQTARPNQNQPNAQRPQPNQGPRQQNNPNRNQRPPQNLQDSNGVENSQAVPNNQNNQQTNQNPNRRPPFKKNKNNRPPSNSNPNPNPQSPKE